MKMEIFGCTGSFFFFAFGDDANSGSTAAGCWLLAAGLGRCEGY